MAEASFDTIIIGGGFAGITAARELTQLGQRVVLLEAADRLGGRAWASELGGVPIELGGGYVHWSQPHLWSEVTRYGLRVKERPYYTSTNAMRKTRFLIDGVLREDFTAAESAQIKAAFAEYLAPALEVFPEPYDPYGGDAYQHFDALSAEDRIDQLDLTPLAWVTLMRTAGMQCNNAPREGGYVEALRWYALAHFDDETYAASLSRFTLRDGTGALLEAILGDSSADVVTDARVSAVSAGDGVKVTATTGIYAAKACIVATGVNVWKNIVFEPGLSPEKEALTAEGLSGRGGKVYVQIKGRFEDSPWSAIGPPILSVLPHFVSDEFSLVVAFTNPEHPLPEVTVKTIQEQFDKFAPGYEVIAVKHHDWIEDPLVAGTWGNLRPGQFSKYLRQAQRAEGPIHFATSDIAQGWRGFFDGAIESGLRAARGVLGQG